MSSLVRHDGRGRIDGRGRRLRFGVGLVLLAAAGLSLLLDVPSKPPWKPLAALGAAALGILNVAEAWAGW